MSTIEADTEILSERESLDEEPKAAEPDDVADECDDTATDGPQRGTRWIRRRWRAVAIVCVLLASAGSAAAVYFGGYHDADETAGETTAAIDAASDGSVALLSYAPDSLDQDIATARSHLTGEFLTYYSQFAEQFVTPASKEKDIRAAASVVRAAAIDVQPHTAQVLVFLNQATTSRTNPQPVQAASAVKVGLTKVDGDWRISSFDPV
ncbi:twin-arginine translocation pathway signal [Mycobacterium sp. NS-7484]|uniref:twin-arginine translocation pathway signal n=1 Tax=Mycobacterium sp. NS-7484 TaxID=1834161 RepID=UPI00096F2D57|nr:twin-arginine translocation pathway signal [Mycobacterium sp. NS-7484]OMB93470.1 twin-arginine translocation pathway signal [Mycobacterium sp. NS-7484]